MAGPELGQYSLRRGTQPDTLHGEAGPQVKSVLHLGAQEGLVVLGIHRIHVNGGAVAADKAGLGWLKEAEQAFASLSASLRFQPAWL